MNVNFMHHCTLCEFTGLFRDLYTEWFDPAKQNLWFNASSGEDTYLCNKYFISINDFTYNNELVNESIGIQIGAIIALDQISRHYQRTVNYDCNELLRGYSKLASEISISLMTNLSANTEAYNTIKADEWCFILLPFRHLQDLNKMNTITRFIIEKHNKYNTLIEEQTIYKRFLMHTLDQVYKLNTNKCILDQKNIHNIHINTCNQWIKYATVLEHNPIEKIQTEYQDIEEMYVFKKFSESIQSIKTEQLDNMNLIISLSGGVDSCVCLYLVRLFFPEHNIIAVHINYGNRDDNELEIKFVRKYCAVLNIKLFYREITEICRDDCHHQGLRDIYEKITRDIRFDMYKKVSELYDEKPSLVLLGHNQDDCFENIITNISNRKHYDNLCGMALLSIIDEVRILRPLIDIKKTEIIVFAIKMNIPFLKNSTPIWSNRGKIRDIILPALQNINKNIMNSFLELGTYSNEIKEITKKYVNNILTTNFKNNKCTFDKKYLPYSKIVWTNIFDILFKGKKISHKSVTEFIKYLQRFDNYNDTKCIKFELCKNIKVVGKILQDNVVLSFDNK